MTTIIDDQECLITPTPLPHLRERERENERVSRILYKHYSSQWLGCGNDNKCVCVFVFQGVWGAL